MGRIRNIFAVSVARYKKSASNQRLKFNEAITGDGEIAGKGSIYSYVDVN
jgi:hypothetical protein